MKFTLNDSWVDDLVALIAYLFLIMAVFIERGWSLVFVEIAIGAVGVAWVGRLGYVLCRKENGRGRAVTWRRALAGALYWVLLAVILGGDFSASWVLWGLAGLFGLGAVAIGLTKK